MLLPQCREADAAEVPADDCCACAGYYSCLSFSMAQLLIEVPYLLGLTVMFTPIVYAMIGLQWTAAKFFWCDVSPLARLDYARRAASVRTCLHGMADLTRHPCKLGVWCCRFLFFEYLSLSVFTYYGIFSIAITPNMPVSFVLHCFQKSQSAGVVLRANPKSCSLASDAAGVAVPRMCISACFASVHLCVRLRLRQT